MPLIDTYVEESLSSTDADTKSLLSSILNLNLQDSSNEKLIINLINKLLSLSKTRLKGLEFLNLIISNCSKLHIIENANLWMSYCLVKHAGDNIKEIKLTTVGSIIENVQHEQEFNKKFVSEYISKVFESCVSTPIDSHEAKVALDTLTTCMKYYSSWFTLHKEKIENFIILFLDHPSDIVVEKAGIAWVFLQQVGGAGLDGTNHRTNFSKNIHKLCATVHKLLDVFFENEVEIDNYSKTPEDAFTFSNQMYDVQKMHFITARRLTNCLKFLKIMLLKRFPVAKDIRPAEVLDIINRGITLHHCVTDNEKSLKDFEFSLLLSRVQIQLLQLLKIFIIWLQESSLPFSFTISKILIDALRKTQSCTCFSTDSLYQETVYKALGCWLRVCKNSFHVHFQTQLVDCILKDITPVKSHVSLTLQTDTKYKSAKAKYKLIRDRIISSGNQITEDITSAEKYNTEKNCLYALDTLKQLLIGTTLKLNANILQTLYTTIINTILDIQSLKISHPYTKNDCQEKLYEVLVAFYEQETLKLLPPLQLAIDVLNKGISDRNRHIALTCEHGLSAVEKLCQPICPSLFMPEMCVSDRSTDKKESVFDKQVVDKLTDKINSCIDKEGENQSESVSNLEVMSDGNIENQTEVDVEKIGVYTETETEINEEEIDEEGGTTEETNELQPVTIEKSIHILDMKVIQTSSEFEPQDSDKTMEYVPDTPEEQPDKEVEVNSIGHEENVVIETTVLKRETFSSTDIDENELSMSRTSTEIDTDNLDEPPAKKLRIISSTDIDENELSMSRTSTEIDTDNLDEPPAKKVRIIEEETFEEVEIKEEVRSSEEIDDTFEEDGAFVNEVKEY